MNFSSFETILKFTGSWFADFLVDIIQEINKATPNVTNNIDWRTEILLLNKLLLYQGSTNIHDQ